MVISKLQRYRDTRQAYFTTSAEIVDYMVACLHCGEQDTVWEPCGGTGELVDGVLRASPNATIRVSEIHPASVDALEIKYKSKPNVSVFFEDALSVGSQPMFADSLEFTRIIANPPYGAWQTPNRRLELKKRFPGLYVGDTYAVFLIHCLKLLKNGGRLVFIIPDTFLWLNRYEPLRRLLLTDSTIKEIALFPSNFFPGVNFGYSGLSIISLVKEPPRQGTTFRLINQISDVGVLDQLSRDRPYPGQCVVNRLEQERVLSGAHAIFPKPGPWDEVVLNHRPSQALGNIAELRTGFYSGNDRKWLRRADSSVPRSKGYLDVRPSEIALTDNSWVPPLDGICGDRYYIPILRGGASPFIKHTRWYVDWSTRAVKEYRRPGKNPARFQNSRFYFQPGIGVPMVASSKLTAAWLDNRLFDQSIVGVFPYDEQISSYLLGFLNTHLATVLLRRINGTANNSANYLKRLPIVLPDKAELAKAELLISRATADVMEQNTISDAVVQEIEEFYSILWCQT